VSLDLSSFLHPGGRHFITPFGNLPSSNLWTCPYQWSCFVLVSFNTDLVTFIVCLMVVFIILSFLEILGLWRVTWILFQDPARTAQWTLHLGYTNQSVNAV
jgi:hypothetical protein